MSLGLVVVLTIVASLMICGGLYMILIVLSKPKFGEGQTLRALKRLNGFEDDK